MKNITINIKELLNAISKHSNFQPTNESEQIIKECIEIFRTKTNNFTDYSKIITDGIEIKSILIEENINPVDWKTDKGDFVRSELDVLYWLSEELKSIKPSMPQIPELLLKEINLLTTNLQGFKDVKIKDFSKEKIIVLSDYNPVWVKKAKSFGGSWNGSGWIFDKMAKDKIKEALLSIFGVDGENEINDSETVDVLVYLDNLEYSQYNGVFAFGLQLAKRWDRDRAVKLGDGVSVVEGGFDSSSGSRKNPSVGAKQGTVLLVRNVPVAAYENERKQYSEPDNVFKLNQKKIELPKLLLKELELITFKKH